MPRRLWRLPERWRKRRLVLGREPPGERRERRDLHRSSGELALRVPPVVGHLGLAGLSLRRLEHVPPEPEELLGLLRVLRERLLGEVSAAHSFCAETT